MPGKAALIDALYEYRMTPLNRRCGELIEGLRARPGTVLSLHIVVVLADVEQRLDAPGFEEAEAAAAMADLRRTALAVLAAPG
ncbi:hypothetical protein FXF51_44990 [Nonomuraea sp. PA05]|uniref:hypothetical protein n=1 Tax=Nonomuraea sp. PA05 TaxID=2604466 RepID=UPI0011D7128E|nr:hypothetical protein [Nonomuraea sp. PA05]TYB55980.1 hypothetical protein FXF51_44990 [Nonomuraea sp. PA05]